MDQVGVVQIVHSLGVGGMERVASHLALHCSPRYRATVVCLTEKGHFAPELEAGGIEVIALNKQPGRDFNLPRRLAAILRERDIRVVHAHNSGPMFTGTWAARLARVPCVVVTDHSRAYPERRSVIATEYVLARVVNALISVSEDNKRDLVNNLMWPADKIEVIPNGVTAVPEIDAADTAALRREFGLTDGVPTILTAARLEKQKNLGVLVEAVRRLNERGVACRAVLAGDGSARPDLEKQIAAAGLGDRVILAGWRLDTAKLYRICDVMALSSDWEGLPMSVLEAMSAGLPVVSTAVGDVPKAVIDGRTGRLVPPRDPAALADALADVLTDAPARRRLGEAGHALWREQYSVETMVRRYEAVYERFLPRV